jgi:hypothetical protein
VGGDAKAAGDGSQGADPFFWVTLAALAPGVLAAIFAPDKSPGYALGAVGLYRFELGLAFFLASYVLGLILILAYQGRSLGPLKLANVVETDLPDPTKQDPDIAVAKTGFDAFETQATERLDAHDDSFLDIEERLKALEAR